jgi:hypothetical protein
MHQIPFEDVPWLLVTGQGRSGTTVLTRAIAAHPLVCSNRVESNVLKDVLLAGHASSTVDSRVRQMVLDREEHDAVFRRMLTALLFPERLWTEPGRPQALSTFSAMDTDAADFAVSALAGIHFANIVRNGIEVVSSRMRHRVLGQHTFEEHCCAWAAAANMARWGEHRADFTLIRHENLLKAESCRQTLADLLTRAGLPPCDACVEYVQTEQRNRTVYEDEPAGIADNLALRSSRWQYWTREQHETFRRICTPAMEYFGYEIPGED